MKNYHLKVNKYLNYNMDTTNKQPAVEPEKQEMKLVDVEITNENMALNVLVSFVSLANKRGMFSLEESAKIWECIKIFQKK